MVKIIMNSSYVFIIIILSVRLGTDESTSPDYPGKYIIMPIYFLKQSRSFRHGFVLFYDICPHCSHDDDLRTTDLEPKH